MASTDLTRTHTVATADERKKHTFSAWIKLSSTGTIFSNRPSNTYRFYYMILNSGHSYNHQFYCYMVYNGSDMLEARGTRKLRDINGWYHIVVRTDTTQATGSDRFRVYINGEQETLTFGHTPDQNEELQVNRDTVHYIGEEGNGNNQFDGSMSHIHFCDGYSYAPTEFGETDSTTGEWKIKTSPSVSYGTNGFFILKDGNSVTDQSGNSHNWAVNAGTLTKTEDNPSNVFCTINPLDYSPNPATLLSGNTRYNKTSTGSGHNATMTGTLGAMTGKWYFEFKIKDSSAFVVGMVRTNHGAPNSEGYYATDAGSYAITNGSKIVAGSEQSQSLSYSANDIFGMAFDLDNGKFYVHINGTYLNSGDPTSASTGTGSLGNIALGSNIYVPIVSNANYDATTDIEFNFGNGYFGTSAVASAGTNANNLGIFEYDVPSGYTALCTKGLNL